MSVFQVRQLVLSHSIHFAFSEVLKQVVGEHYSPVARSLSVRYLAFARRQNEYLIDGDTGALGKSEYTITQFSRCQRMGIRLAQPQLQASANKPADVREPKKSCGGTGAAGS
jgi:hypothetical protein